MTKALWGTLAVVLLLTLPIAAGAEPDDAQHAKAHAILRNAIDFYRSLESFEVHVTETQAFDFAGTKVNWILGSATLLVEKPMRIAIYDDGVPVPYCLSDGTRLTITSDRKEYTELAAPADFEQLLMVRSISGTDEIGFLPIFMFTALGWDQAVGAAEAAIYLGRESLDGDDTHHLRWVQKESNFDLWIADAPKPVVHRIEVSTSRTEHTGKKKRHDEFARSVVYRDWKLNVAPAADAFLFKIPEGFTKVEEADFVRHGTIQSTSPEEAKPISDSIGLSLLEDNASPLIGQVAPVLKLKLLDGAEIDLRSLQGKQPVLLYFWETWCPGCAEDLRDLESIAEATKDEEVLIIAVNHKDREDEIRQFLAKKRLNVTVAVDSAGTVGAAFGVNGVPHRTLIGRSGAIESALPGIGPPVTEQLHEQLEMLVAGKNIAAEMQAKEKAKRSQEAIAGQRPTTLWSKFRSKLEALWR